MSAVLFEGHADGRHGCLTRAGVPAALPIAIAPAPLVAATLLHQRPSFSVLSLLLVGLVALMLPPLKLLPSLQPPLFSSLPPFFVFFALFLLLLISRRRLLLLLLVTTTLVVEVDLVLLLLHR